MPPLLCPSHLIAWCAPTRSSLSGVSNAEILASPGLQGALKAAVAESASGNNLVVETSQVVLEVGGQLVSRRLLSVATISYTITLTPAQASAAPTAAAAISAAL